MRGTYIVAAGAIAAFLTPLTPLASLTEAAAATTACPLGWEAVASPNVGGNGNGLSDLAVVDGGDIWAVGNSGNSERQTLALHWNGSAWQAVPTPDAPGKIINWLLSADAFAANDVWSVGYGADSFGSDGIDITLTEHWNGSAWSIVPSPNATLPGPYDTSNQLHAVSGVAPDDVWAVGQSYNFSVSRALVEHWDGGAWSVVPSPHPGPYSRLTGVHAIATDDVWAVGLAYDRHGNQVTLIEHWDGVHWALVPSPNVGPYANELLRVDGSSADDVWAVGDHIELFGVSQPYQTSTLHWDGTSWSVVDSPDASPLNNRLFDVATAADGTAYTVGLWDTGSELATLAETWDGTAWTIADSENPQPYINELSGVAVVAPGDAWAVGDASDGFSPFETLIMHLGPACAPMHIASVTASYVPSRSLVRASVVIVDEDGFAVEGAQVAMKVTLPDATQVSVAGTTNTAGRATASVPASQSGTYTFRVTNVSAPDRDYDKLVDVERSDTATVP